MLRVYPDRTIVTNTFAVQDRGTAVCGCYAVLVGWLFIEEEGSVVATLTRLRDWFNTSGDTLANDERMVDQVPVVPIVHRPKAAKGDHPKVTFHSAAE